MAVELMEHQRNVLDHLGNGKILWGGVGSGKGIAVLAYYMEKEQPRDIYVITTAKKRDSLDWQLEAAMFGIGTERSGTVAGTITVDSWNNVGKYRDVRDAFFVFDEQRVVGGGAWVKAFIEISRENHWVLLSATPGDTWMDYIPIFIANGYYKNRTQFLREHVMYAPFNRFPVVIGYLNVRKLELLRNEVLVEMPYLKNTERMINWLPVGYDQKMFDMVWKKRWNIYEKRPIKDASERFRVARKVVNSDPSRLEMVYQMLEVHKRLIIFYNWNYELDILRQLRNDVEWGEHNGFFHHPVPEGDNWVYLVQYLSGAEAWNCTSTDGMVMYSMTNSYKNHEQAMGRIDRINTSYLTLYYYILMSNSITDRGNKQALDQKKNFNEKKFVREIEEMEKNGEIELESVQI